MFRNATFRVAEKLGLNVRMTLAKSINDTRFGKYNVFRRKWAGSPEFISYIDRDYPVAVEDSWACDQSQSIPTLPGLLSSAIGILDQERSWVRSEKGFMVNDLTDDDFFNFPAFLDFATSPQILKIASEYLGIVPVLNSIKLLVSTPSACDSLNSRQLYHLENSEKPMLTLFKTIYGMEYKN